MTMKKLLKLFESEQVAEKAVSQQQQKFMGMVHAMQKGEKIPGASPELKKVAKTMSKKSARDYAATKHKGLPKKVAESVMLEAGNNLEHIVTRFKHETKNFLQGAELDDDLYNALYDYYIDNGEMPYGVAKAREGDPYSWVSQHFEDALAMMGHQRQFQETVMPIVDDQLSELARLAGLSEGSATNPMAQKQTAAPGGVVDTMKQGFQDYKDLWMMGATGQTPDRWKNPAEKNASQATKTTTNEIADENIEECGDMGMDQKDTMNISTNMSSDGTKNVTISASGDNAEELLQMLKLAGMGNMGTNSEKSVLMVSGNDEEMMDEEYANSPEEEYQTVNSITRQGNDLNREKRQYADKPKLGDNPLATMSEDITLEAELEEMLNSILVREADSRRPKGDTGQAEIFTADLGINPPSPDEGPVGKQTIKPPKAPQAPVSPTMPRPGIKK